MTQSDGMEDVKLKRNERVVVSRNQSASTSIHSSFSKDLAEKWYGIVRQVTCKIQTAPQAKSPKSDVLARSEMAIQKSACFPLRLV